ncbi:cation:proton antiporter [Bdellovibrio sp. HCB337]|uniref:cation:proton antiporter n=1 Tax=Bdellovibrio sp. HCB337 TaxID=3394358 RepID=UPI0039A6C2F4
MFLFIYILIGILLGPSFVKATAPEWLFSLASFGFLFVAGFELDLQSLKKDASIAAKLATGAFLLPFIAGIALAFFALGKSDVQGLLVVAIAFAISALPVVVQILKDLKIYETRQGHIIVAAATICDLLAWVIFTIIIPVEAREKWIMSHLPVFFFFIGVGLSSILKHTDRMIQISTNLGKFVFGPIFFIGVGMKINWQETFDLKQCLLILVVATLSKMLGVFVTARQVGFDKRDSSLLAFVLNARGAMEILFCAIAFKLGLIDATLFTSLIIMAVLSSVIASPLVKIFLSSRK